MQLQNQNTNSAVWTSKCRQIKSQMELLNLIHTNTLCTSQPESSAIEDIHTRAHAHTRQFAFLQNSPVAVSQSLMGLGGLSGSVIGTNRPTCSVGQMHTPCRMPVPTATCRLLGPTVTQSRSFPKGPLPAPQPHHASGPLLPPVASGSLAHTALSISLLNVVDDLG